MARSPRLQLECIDILRGVAALAVVFHHASNFFWRTEVNSFWSVGLAAFGKLPPLELLSELIFGVGYMGVPFFFVISGFCIHLAYAPMGSKPMRWRPYTIRRLLRLYPPYIAAVLLAAAMVYLSSGTLNLATLIGHFFFWIYGDHPLGGSQAYSPVLWSLMVEVELYLIYALLFPLLLKVGLGKVTLAALVLGVAYHVIAISIYHNSEQPIPHVFHWRNFVFARLGEWLTGAWLAELARRGVPSLSHAVTALMIFAGIAGIFLAAWLTPVLGLDRYAFEIAASLGAAAVILAMIAREQQAGPPGSLSLLRRAMHWSGVRCYTLYLFHFSVIALVGEVAARLFHLDKDASAGSMIWLAVTLVGIVAAVIVTEVVYRLVERPAHHYARQLSLRWP